MKTKLILFSFFCGLSFLTLAQVNLQTRGINDNNFSGELLAKKIRQGDSLSLGEVKGTPFFHEDFTDALLYVNQDQEKPIPIKMKFNAYTQEFVTIEQRRILPNPHTTVVIGQERWVYRHQKWLRFLHADKDTEYYHHPTVIFKEERKAKTSYEKNYPPTFARFDHYYVLSPQGIEKVAKRKALKHKDQ